MPAVKRSSKKEIGMWIVKNIFLLDIAKYLSERPVQKNRKVVNV